MTTSPSPPRIDFTQGAIAYRLRSGQGRGGALARAVRLRADTTIVDATAGLGRDGFVLASLGASVILIERVAAVHDALAAALRHAAAGPPDVAAAVARMRLLHGDARTLLPVLAPQTVLVDPMHPARGNTALVKQPMRQLRAIVGADADVAELMQIALRHAGRVVLKWPRRADPLPGLRPPSHSIAGKTTRYDVFIQG